MKSVDIVVEVDNINDFTFEHQIIRVIVKLTSKLQFLLQGTQDSYLSELNS